MACAVQIPAVAGGRVRPSVVEIITASGLGSGVVYDTAGHIVTNAHVVGTATSFQVVLAGSVTPLAARLTGSYPPDDLAVIQVTGAAHLVPAHFADSSKLQVGDIVLAMGNPLGLASSATDGIISAVGRTVSEPAEGGSPGANPVPFGCGVQGADKPEEAPGSGAISTGGASTGRTGRAVSGPGQGLSDRRSVASGPGFVRQAVARRVRHSVR